MLQFLILILLLCITIYIMKRSKESEGVRNTFMLLLVSLSIWLLCSYVIDKGWSEEITLLLLKIDFIIAELIFLFFLLFALEINRNTQRSLTLYILLTLVPIFLAYHIITNSNFFTNISIVPFEHATTINNIKIEFGSVHKIYIAYMCSCIISSLFVLSKKMFQLHEIQRLQLQFIIIGFVISCLITTIHAFLLPYFNLQSTTTAHISQYGTVVFALCTTYAITRYRFLGIRIIIHGKKKRYDLSKIASKIEKATAENHELQTLTATIKNEFQKALNVQRVEIISKLSSSNSAQKLLSIIGRMSQNTIIITQELPFKTKQPTELKKLLKLLHKEHIGIIISTNDPNQTTIIIHNKPKNKLFSKIELETLENITPQLITSLRYALLYQQTKERIQHTVPADQSTNV